MSDLNVGQTATITARNRQAPFQYQIQDYHPFSMAMKKMGGIGRLSGGRDVLERFAYQSTGTAAWMPESGEISLAQRQIADEAVFDWYYAGGSYTISGPEKRNNKGEHQYTDVVTMKQMVLEEEMTNIYHSALLSSGAVSNQLPGLLSLVSKTPATGTLGGITLSGASFYQNFDFDTSADWSDGSVDAGNVKRFLSKLLNATTYQGKKRFGIMGDTHYEFLEQALQAHQRVAKTDDGVGQTHDYLTYRGVKWYFGGGVNFSGESQLADDQTYLLTPGKGSLQICFHEDAEFKFLPQVNARNEDAFTVLCILQLAFTVNRRKQQATGYDS